MAKAKEFCESHGELTQPLGNATCQQGNLGLPRPSKGLGPGLVKEQQGRFVQRFLALACDLVCKGLGVGVRAWVCEGLQHALGGL